MRILIALLTFSSLAFSQSAEVYDFLSTASIYPDVHGSLSRFLKDRAFHLIEQRNQKAATWSSVGDLDARRRLVRERMWADLGGMPQRTPLNAKVVGRLDRGDFVIEKVIFESRPKFYVTANVYIPKTGQAPFPAILYPLGHEEGAKAHSAWQRTLVNLTRRGFLCVTWDPLGQGERVQYYDADFHDSKLQGSTTEHTMLGTQCLLTGTHIAQYTVWDGIRALDYMLSRPDVDARRVGVTGNSGGGTHTAYLAALDDRIQVAAASCYITSWRRMLESIGPQDAEQVFPFWLKDGLDYPDFIYAFTGKPFLILSAIRDFFPIGGARSTYAEALRVEDKIGMSEKISMVEADDGHGYTKPRREAAYRWFSRWLQKSENTEPEFPVDLASTEELNCTASGQVALEYPGAADVHSINAELARHLRESRKPTPEDVRRRAGELARYEPPKTPIAVTPYGKFTRAGVTIEKLTYESEPGIAIPALLLIPGSGPARKQAILLADSRGKAAAMPEALGLANAGHVVLVPDLRGFGETGPAEARGPMGGYFGNYKDAMTALLVGRTMPGMRALDVVRGVDVLTGRSEVDPARIAVVGRAGAGIPALYAALFDPRIASLALDHTLVSYDEMVSDRLHRGMVEQVVPSALKYFDLPDVVSALSPRRVAIFDPVNPIGQKLTVQQVRARYAPAVQVSNRTDEEKPFSAALLAWLR